MLAMAGMMMGVATGGGGGFTSLPGIDFRHTAAYVTDGADDTYCLAELYPTTRASSGGRSATFGWQSALTGDAGLDSNATYDPRIAGANSCTNSGAGTARVFQLDLPDGAGTYAVELAFGAYSGQAACHLDILDSDGTTALLTFDSTALGGSMYLDANNTLYTNTTWPTSETPKSVTVSGSHIYVRIGGATSEGAQSPVAYFKAQRTA